VQIETGEPVWLARRGSSAAGRLSFDKLRHDANEVRRRLRERDDGAAVAAVKLDGSTHDLAAIYGVCLHPRKTKTPRFAGFRRIAGAGFEPATFGL
jgi:hypothetical protein